MVHCPFPLQKPSQCCNLILLKDMFNNMVFVNPPQGFAHYGSGLGYQRHYPTVLGIFYANRAGMRRLLHWCSVLPLNETDFDYDSSGRKRTSRFGKWLHSLWVRGLLFAIRLDSWMTSQCAEDRLLFPHLFPFSFFTNSPFVFPSPHANHNGLAIATSC